MQTPENTLPAITARTALFLDFDGTLVEIASRPDAVIVSPSLKDTLATLHRKLDGALALVSGRRLLDLDGLLAPLRLPAAAEHGAVRRDAKGKLVSAPATDLQHVIAAATDLIEQYPELQLEQKKVALSLHYRNAPELEDRCVEAMRAAVERSDGLHLMQGKCVLDVRLAAFNKGTAIAAFMREAPFAGRLPVFVGDDVTDEDGFVEVQRAGGHAVKVGMGATSALYGCSGVADVMAWLASALACSPGTRRESLVS